MTGGNKLYRTLSNLESVKADLAALAAGTHDEDAKMEFSEHEKSLREIIVRLRNRVSFTGIPEGLLDEQDHDHDSVVKRQSGYGYEHEPYFH